MRGRCHTFMKKLIYSILSFLLGLWLLFSLISVVFISKSIIKSMDWLSLESLGIILLMLFFLFYTYKNLIVPFKKGDTNRKDKTLMVVLHSILLIVLLSSLLFNYNNMQIMNVVTNLLLLATISYLIFYQISGLKKASK